MQLSWSTFLLEIVNFLVLVWILKRFLYKPVLEAIARRKAAIDKTLAGAQARQTQAEALEQQYQNRLADWEREKEGLRAGLAEEMRGQRERLTADLQKALQQEREKEGVLAERHLAEMESHAAEQGTAKAVKFTARLLDRIASPELEARLATLVAEDLPRLPAEQIAALQEACRDAQHGVKVASAFPLPEAQRARVVQALNEATHENVAPSFLEDPSLRAGLRISAGPWTVRANLQDELRYFTEMMNHERRGQ
jgi:F-type H+-transporting ATPase subunit b